MSGTATHPLSGLKHVVQTMTRLCGDALDETTIVAHGERLMRTLVAQDNWLPEALAQPHPEFYRQYLLHADPLGRFSLVSFVWGPGQQTPVHDHTVWGIISMLRGAEFSQGFHASDAGPLVAGAEHRLNPGLPGDPGLPLAVGRRNPLGQHYLRRDWCQRRLGGRNQGIGLGPRNHHRNPGIGAELPRSHDQRRRPARANRLTPRLDRLGQQEHRVDRAQFAKERNGFRPPRTQVEQRATATQAAGKAHRLDQRMLHQTFTDIALAALHQAEHARMQAQRPGRGVNRLGDNLAGAGMGRMPLDHHGAARSQGRGGVAACGGKSQREVRRAEHRNRADRSLHHADLGPRRWFAVGQGGIVAAVEIVAGADMPGKQTQLTGGAPPLPLQPCRRQAGFRGADGGNLGPPRLDLIGDSFQKLRPRLAGQNRIAGECRLGPFDGGIDMGRGADGEGQGLTRRGRGLERRIARDPLARDQVFSGQHGGLLFCGAGDFASPDPCRIFVPKWKVTSRKGRLSRGGPAKKHRRHGSPGQGPPRTGLGPPGPPCGHIVPDIRP